MILVLNNLGLVNVWFLRRYSRIYIRLGLCSFFWEVFLNEGMCRLFAAADYFCCYSLLLGLRVVVALLYWCQRTSLLLYQRTFLFSVFLLYSFYAEFIIYWFLVNFDFVFHHMSNCILLLLSRNWRCQYIWSMALCPPLLLCICEWIPNITLIVNCL